jgi:hypothetical protein
MKYTSEYGSYYLRDDRGRILWMGQSIAVLIDTDTMTLLKHGDEAVVSDYVQVSRERAQDGGFADLTRSWTFVASEKWDLDLLNRCLSHAGGAVAELCKVLGVVPI